MVSADDRTQGDDLIETTFSGIVTDSVTKEPIEGAVVSGFDDFFREMRDAVTDESGEYYLEFNSGGHYTLYAQKDGYYQVMADQTVEIDTDTVIDFQMVPKVNDTVISGVVTDGQTGDPLPNVFIELMELIQGEDGWTSNYYLGYQITDSEGHYSFDAYGGTFLISASLEDYYDYMAEITVLSGERYRLDISLQQWDTGITGVVMDGSNSGPLMGVTVTLEGPWGSFSNTTDENGLYEIMLPQGGEHTLKAFKDGYQPYNRDVDVPDGTMTEYDLVMREAFLPDPLLQIFYYILSLIGII
jgi:hypothetical protein